MMRRQSWTTIAVVGLVVIGVLFRLARYFGWLPLPPNVAPISALALFGGAILPRRWMFVVPLAAMLASDLIIGFYTLPVMLSVYAAFAGSNLLGRQLRSRRTVPRIMAASLLGSLLFFVITNSAVWAFQQMYSHTWSGLGQAWIAGLPFLRNTVLGDLAFSGLFFGVYQLIVVYSEHRTKAASQTTIYG